MAFQYLIYCHFQTLCTGFQYERLNQKTVMSELQDSEKRLSNSHIPPLSCHLKTNKVKLQQPSLFRIEEECKINAQCLLNPWKPKHYAGEIKNIYNKKGTKTRPKITWKASNFTKTIYIYIPFLFLTILNSNKERRMLLRLCRYHIEC